MYNRYAIVEDGVVTNIVLWDGKSEWAGADQAVICDDTVKIGDLYLDNKFINTITYE